MPFWQGTTLPSTGPISLNQIHVESGGTSGTTINFNHQRIRNLTGFKKSKAGAKSFSQCRGAYQDGFPGVSNRGTAPIAVYGDGPSWSGSVHSFVGHQTITSRRRSFAYGNTFSTYYTGGNSYTYTNNTSVIQYFARSFWEDEGEGDYDGAIIVVAVAPGGSATAYTRWMNNNGNYFSTNNSNLARVVLDVNDISESYPRDGSGNGALPDTGTLYPFGLTVDAD